MNQLIFQITIAINDKTFPILNILDGNFFLEDVILNIGIHRIILASNMRINIIYHLFAFFFF